MVACARRPDSARYRARPVRRPQRMLNAGAAVGERRLGPLSISAHPRDMAIAHIVAAVAQRRSLRVAFANTHLLYCALRDPAVGDLLERFYILNDGIGVSLLARLLCGAGFRDNLNGTDFTPQVLSCLPDGARVFMVGAHLEVAAKAAEEFQSRWPHLDLCGWRDGFDGSECALREVRELQPDVVLAAMGNPLQERWITRAALVAPDAVFLGVGALFDFMAGAVPRAPLSWRRMHMEWAYRMMREPHRL